MIKQSESEFQKAVIEYAELRQWLVYHTHDSRRSAKGFPDLCMVRDDRVVFAELKTMRGKITAEQSLWLDALGRTMAEPCLFRPSDWEQIERVLR